MHEERVRNEYDRRAQLLLGLQIKQMSDEIFVNQAKYTKKLIKKFNLENAKVCKIPMATMTKSDKNEQSKKR